MTVRILPCRLAHLRAVAPNLRAEEQIELEAVGLKPRHALIDLWRETIGPRAAVKGDDVLAVWGDMAPPLAREGRLWMATTLAVERVPITFARVAQAELRRMLVSRETIRCSVAMSCTRALRFAAMLGFETIEDTMRLGFIDLRLAR